MKSFLEFDIFYLFRMIWRYQSCTDLGKYIFEKFNKLLVPLLALLKVSHLYAFHFSFTTINFNHVFLKRLLENCWQQMTRFVCDVGIRVLTNVDFRVLKILFYQLRIDLMFFSVYPKFFLPKVTSILLIDWPDSCLFSSQSRSIN